MIIDEGYVKYQSDWKIGPAPDVNATDLLNRWRRPLFSAGLIGHYDDINVGYGNISVRGSHPGQFVISGTRTGHIADTGGEHYALVTAYDIRKNRVSCTGPVQASSESLTHAAIYELDTGIGAVVHVHNRLLWDQLLNRMPTTSAEIAYGTPGMAREFRRLYRETDFGKKGLAVMAGHDEGIVSIGATLEQAAGRILQLNSSISTGNR